jgi:hypothetical protein
MKGAANPQSCFLYPTDYMEVLKIMQTFKPKKSTGDDGISMSLLKHISEECCLPLAMIINKSLEQGTVPDHMKLAKVVPIYKAKSKELLTNYRPISLLPNISKILEKVVYGRLTFCLVISMDSDQRDLQLMLLLSLLQMFCFLKTERITAYRST